ncbi:hypothetical protein Clacol_002452 [Clathrus columnatus]|uniref:non-specific serine/threonine protein kinase n=1 Tax=Clathrus columnatus TaxID=1419009 RepID=A0AAV5A4Y4_9AGAM|nr:hypothetical protein Clacol_002452 [Clathrus columnatus]
MTTATQPESAEPIEEQKWPEENLASTVDQRGGFYPTRLGEMFEDGRFVVTRKLGWGAFSSVWLARDRLNDRHVALKILSAYGSKRTATGQLTESKVLARLASSNPSHRGFPHVLPFLEEFTFESFAGQHVCFVTEPLSFNVPTLRSYLPNKVFPLKLILNLVEDLLKGLEYLHDECGIVHSDLSPSNILLRPFDLDEIIMHQLAEEPSTIYGFPHTVSPKDLPFHPVSSIPLPFFHKSDSGERLHWVITDLGEAQFTDKPLTRIAQSYALRAPEVIMGLEYGPPIDIWSLGCLMYEFIAGQWLFDPKRSDDIPMEIDHLAQITQRTGEHFNEAVLQNYALRKEIKDITGRVILEKFIPHLYCWTEMLENAKARNSHMGLVGSDFIYNKADSQEVEEVIKFIKSCLTLDPAKRISAKEALNNPIFEDS